MQFIAHIPRLQIADDGEFAGAVHGEVDRVVGFELVEGVHCVFGEGGCVCAGGAAEMAFVEVQNSLHHSLCKQRPGGWMG